MTDSKQIPSLHVYAVEDFGSNPRWLKMQEIPVVGDTIIVEDGDNYAVFEVTERGQIAGPKKLSCGWMRLKNVQDPNVAPGSYTYQFMEEFRKSKP
jgi:hypothetical protein